MKLLEFPHSHFCEKARWALDYKKVLYQTQAIMPGLHLKTIRKYAPGTSVPVLLNGEEVVQGSSEIIDYLEKKIRDRPLTPTDTLDCQECLEIERTMDKRLGESIRQILYFGLLAYPNFIRHCFTHPMVWWKQLLFRPIFPVLRNKIYQVYVKSPESVERARNTFNAAIDDIEQKLRNEQYLVGNQFTRADLSVASMLSLLVMPPEHPFPWQDIPDSETKTFLQEYRDHPVSIWVGKMYFKHR
ncbi:MAG: glutathione S-transferase family protein [Desulfobacterales bacterium]|nr:glutathione S-transferase family protein [Desulfobacterales bacterium]